MSFSIACSIIRETDNAILIEDPVTEDNVWIPLSQVEEIHRDPGGKTGVVVMTDWIADQKGLRHLRPE